MFKFIKIFFEKIDLMLTEDKRNEKYVSWSSTKIGIFFFLYPVSSFCLIYDTYINAHLDWINLSIYGLLIVSPRALSNIVALRLGQSIETTNTNNDTVLNEDNTLKN
jgi:hypothetical protein